MILLSVEVARVAGERAHPNVCPVVFIIVLVPGADAIWLRAKVNDPFFLEHTSLVSRQNWDLHADDGQGNHHYDGRQELEGRAGWHPVPQDEILAH